MRILITGICGFVGSALAESLLGCAEGLTIFGIDNLMRPGSETNRARLRSLGIGFSHGDIRSASDVTTLPRADWVIDAAANPSVLAGITGECSTRQLFEHNLCSLVNILEYCKTHSSGLVLLSSSRVYAINTLLSLPLRVEGLAFHLDASSPLPPGVSARGISKDFSTQAPVSLYGSTKLAAEAVALEYGSTFGFPVWVNRCGVLAGAGQFGTPDQGIFSFWINAHLRRRPLRYIGFEGSGRQIRDALHPQDLAMLLRAQMKCTRVGGQRIYTAGGGPDAAMSLAQLNEWCDDRFGKSVPLHDPQPRPYDVPWIVMDNSDAARDFEWRRQVKLTAVLEQIAVHAESHPDWLQLSGL